MISFKSKVPLLTLLRNYCNQDSHNTSFKVEASDHCPVFMKLGIWFKFIVNSIKLIHYSMPCIILGSFFGGIAYLQYHGLVNINWERIEVTSNQAAIALTNAINGQAADSIMSILGLPLAGSMTIGFVIGFMKG